MIKLVKVIKRTKRLGRGPSSGKGKTSARGMNGQKSRAGASTVLKNGGQTKFYIGLPKAKGFKAREQKYISLNAGRLNGLFKDGEKVTKKEILDKLKISEKEKPLKIFSLKSLKAKITFDNSIIFSKPREK
ncbi:MAG: 50S ribosomal protein L15 [bacterium]